MSRTFNVTASSITAKANIVDPFSCSRQGFVTADRDSHSFPNVTLLFIQSWDLGPALQCLGYTQSKTMIYTLQRKLFNPLLHCHGDVQLVHQKFLNYNMNNNYKSVITTT